MRESLRHLSNTLKSAFLFFGASLLSLAINHFSIQMLITSQTGLSGRGTYLLCHLYTHQTIHDFLVWICANTRYINVLVETPASLCKISRKGKKQIRELFVNTILTVCLIARTQHFVLGMDGYTSKCHQYYCSGFQELMERMV